MGNVLSMTLSILIILAVIAAVVIPWFKIISKIGYSGWWSLLMLVPVVNLIMPFVIAFKEWPLEARLRESEINKFK